MAKAYASYTIFDMERLNPPFLKELNEEETKDYKESILFLKQLSTVKLWLGKVSYHDIFFVKKIFKIDNVKEKIFELEQSGYVKKESYPVLSLDASKVKAIYTSFFAEKKRQINSNIEANTRSIRDYSTSISNYMVAIAKSRTELELYNTDGKIDEYLKQINDISNGDTWLFAGVDSINKFIYFINKEPIILRDYRPSVGVDKSCNIGYWRLRFSSGVANLFPFFGSPNASSEHPHVSGGTICFGDKAAIVTEMITKGDLVGIAAICHSLLSTVGGSPYTDIDQYFKRSHEKNNRNVQVNSQQMYDLGWTKEMAEFFIDKPEMYGGTSEQFKGLIKLIVDKQQTILPSAVQENVDDDEEY